MKTKKKNTFRDINVQSYKSQCKTFRKLERPRTF